MCSRYTHCLLIVGTLAWCAIAPATAQPATAALSAPSDGTLLSIAAQAESKRVPDVATMSTGVVTQAPDANSAMRRNAEQMNRVMAAIKASGVAERDIQTSGISINPQYQYNKNNAPKITGYEANNTVSIKVRDIAKLGEVLDILVAEGANQVNGPYFEVDHPDEAYDEARRAALDKARDRAAMYAKALGLRVRRIVSIDEGGGYRPPPMPMRIKAMAMDAQESSPVAPGETTLTANLDVVFELGR